MAILIVFFSHAGFDRVIPGLFGVTIFFFLSGYLITTLIRKEYQETGSVALKAFYVRRCWRLLPPLYIVLAALAFLSLTGWVHCHFAWSGLAAQAFYFGNYYRILWPNNELLPGTGITWSLAVEEHFYMCFPLIFLALRWWCKTLRQQLVILSSLCLCALAWRCCLVWGFHVPLGTYCPRICHGTDTRLDAILYGCILGCIGNPMLDEDRGSKGRLFGAWIPACLAVLLFSFLFRAPWFRESFRYTVQGVALYPFFIASIRHPSHLLFRPLNWGWVRLLGAASYSFYLIHGPVIVLFKEWWPRCPQLLHTAGTFAASLFLTLIMYFFVEKPVARCRRRHCRPPMEKSDSSREQCPVAAGC